MIVHDFSRPVSLGHYVFGTGVLDGTTEIGRARARVGTGDAGLDFAAAELGAHANGVGVVLAPAASRRSVRVDPAVGSGSPRLVYTPTVGTAREAAQDFPAALGLGMSTREAAAYRARFNVAATPTGDGSGAVASGSATFAGGAEPSLRMGVPMFEAENANGGLFAFDANEPLLLRQIFLQLDASTAWSVTLRLLTATRQDMGISAVVASGTGQQVLHACSIIVPPGFGVGVSAATQGVALVTVSHARG